MIPKTMMDYTPLHGWLFRLRFLYFFALRVRVLSDIARPAVPSGLEVPCALPNWEVPLSLREVRIGYVHEDIELPLPVSLWIVVPNIEALFFGERRIPFYPNLSQSITLRLSCKGQG